MARVAFVVCLSLGLIAPGLALSGPSLVFDAKSGAVMHSEDANAPWFPASLTKLMTVYLAFEAIKAGRLSLSSELPVSAHASRQPPSKIGLPPGATISLEKALETVIVKSANDIAVVIAEAVSGSEAAFVAQMNATARALGMTATRFANPNGLPDIAQVTTARDMGLLAQAILREHPAHAHFFALEHVQVGRSALRSHNNLLRSFDGADGMKTGFICASGYNVVASATRNGRKLVAVVLGGASGKARNDTAAQLLERGFDAAWLKSILPTKLDELAPETSSLVHSRPVHMGPVVCKGRYDGSNDAYEVDARIWASTQSRMTKLQDVPLPPERPDISRTPQAGRM